MHRLLLPAATLLLLLAAPAASGITLPEWPASPTTITAGGEAATSSRPQIVLDDAHGATAVWVRNVGGGVYQLRSAHRNPGSSTTWGTPVDLGVSSNSLSIEEQALAIAGNGDVSVIWQAQDDGNVMQVWTVTRSGSTGAWSSPELLSIPTAQSSDGVLTYSDDGTLWAMWNENESGGDRRMRVGRRLTGESTWTISTYISPAGVPTGYPLLAVAPNGDLAASWTNNNNDVNTDPESNHLYVRVRDHGSGTWGTTRDLGQTTLDSTPQGLAFTYDNTLHVAWTSYGVVPSTWRISYASMAAGGGWTSSTPLSSEFGVNPSLTVTTGDNLLATWSRVDSETEYSLAVRTKLSGGSWSAEEALTDVTGFASGSRPVALPNGAAQMPFLFDTDGFFSLKPRIATWIPDPGEYWTGTAFASLSSGVANGYMDLAVDGDGDAAAVWKIGGNAIVASVADGAGPKLNNVFIGTSAIVGINSGFHVEPVDTWSDVTTVGWDFGDGATGDGADATHAYSAAGVYTVTVTSGDALSHESFATSTINVTAPDPPETTTTTTTTTTTDGGGTQSTQTNGGGDGGVPTTETPFTEPTPTTTTPTVLPPQPGKPVEARLRGRKLTVAAVVTLKRGARCRGTAKATTTVSKKHYTLKLQLKTVKKTCVASGSVTLKKAPKKTAKVVIKISGRGFTARTLAATRA